LQDLGHRRELGKRTPYRHLALESKEHKAFFGATHLRLITAGVFLMTAAVLERIENWPRKPSINLRLRSKPDRFSRTFSAFESPFFWHFWARWASGGTSGGGHRHRHVICLAVDSLPSRFGDSDPTDLDRLAAGLHHLTLCCDKYPMNESDRHSSTEAVTEDPKFLVEAAPARLRASLARVVAQH